MQKFSSHNFNSDDFGRVAVLLGGTSAERDISLLSGEAIYSALESVGVDVVKIDPSKELHQQLIDGKIERVFIALHGRDGEDGVIQGFLKLLGIAYTGSDIASSALAMNKLNSKRIWMQMNLPTADFDVISRTADYDLSCAKHTQSTLGCRLFVKPICEGSSVGMSKTNSAEALVKAVALAQQYDDVLIEKFIDGREYTVSILGTDALPSIRMETPNEFYDYDAKYCSDKTEYFCPSGLSDKEESSLKKLALDAFFGIGCSGWGRVDFIRDTQTGQFMLLEANTVPGMTKTSLVPKAAAAVGLDFTTLVLNILAGSFHTEKLAGVSSHG